MRVGRICYDVPNGVSQAELLYGIINLDSAKSRQMANILVKLLDSCFNALSHAKQIYKFLLRRLKDMLEPFYFTIPAIQISAEEAALDAYERSEDA